MTTPFGNSFWHRLLHRVEKTVMTLLSSEGTVVVVVTVLIVKGFLTATFTEYTIFTIGMLGVKAFKPQPKGEQLPPQGA